jgi:hypothetical protein
MSYLSDKNIKRTEEKNAIITSSCLGQNHVSTKQNFCFVIAREKEKSVKE